jgi:hypothetical protein
LNRNEHRPTALGSGRAATNTTEATNLQGVDVVSTVPRQRGPLSLLPTSEPVVTKTPIAPAVANADDVDKGIEFFAKTGRLFTADDVRGRTGEPAISPNQFAGRFSVAKRRGVVEEVAASPSSRRLRRRGLRRIWVGSSSWRSENPEEAS